MRVIPSRRPLFFGGAALPLLGATWARDGSGRAYNTPTLGSELLTNGDFSAWSGDNPTGWTVNSESGSDPAIHQVGSGESHVGSGTGSANFYSSTTSHAYLTQSLAITIGKWYRTDLISSYVGNGGLSFRWGFSSTPIGIDIAKTYIATSQATATSVTLIRFLAPIDITVDSASVRELSLPTLHAYRLGTSPSQIAAARINALTTGTHAGAFALVDNPASPTNGIYADHDGTGVTLDKLVAGTWSNVIARVTVAFSADADLEIRPLGSNQFDLYYGGVKRGSTATISDASIVNNLYYGLFSTYSGNTFTRFTLDGNVIPFGF